MSSSLRDQLPTPRKGNANVRGVDGIDHINIYSNGQSELGRELSLETRCKFKHPILGPFTSMTGYWTFVKSYSHSDAYRNKPAKSCLFLSKKQNDVKKQVINFTSIILEGMYYRIISDEKLVQDVKESTLPFDMYYVKKVDQAQPSTNKIITYEIKISHRYTKWMVAGLTEIRDALKQNRTPSFERFLDDPNVPLYQEFVSSSMEKEPNPVPEQEALVDNESVELSDELTEQIPE